jgi:ribonuclease HI
MDRNILKSREKALRLPEEHPRWIAHNECAPKRLERHTWCSKADELARRLDIQDLSPRKPLSFHVLAPWHDEPLENVHAHVPGLAGRSESEERKIELSYKRIRELAADYTIYSDGSASAGVRDGGAGVVITVGDPENPTVVDTLMKKGSVITCSFNEEATAMDVALDWIEEHCVESTRVAICTDSQSLCEALLGFGQEIAELRKKLLRVKADISIQWIPAHSNIAGNELADAAAKEATTLDADPTDITFKSVCAYIKASIKDEHTHERSARVYAGYSKKKEEEIKTRADQVLIGRIRAGHHWGLESYHLLVDKDHDARCKECGADLHDLEHWFCSCYANSHIRQRMFGSHVVKLDRLTSDPTAAIAFTREALGLNKAQ